MMSIRLRERVVTTRATRGAECLATLAQLVPGRSGTVQGVRDDAGPAVARRLFDLGFAPGAEVQVVRRAPLADPVIFRVAGYEIALRRVHAALVDVAPTA